jgi:hypothetical protein
MKMAEAYSQIERWLEITRKRIYQFACGQIQHFHCVDGTPPSRGWKGKFYNSGAVRCIIRFRRYDSDQLLARRVASLT